MGLLVRAPFKPQKRDWVAFHAPGDPAPKVRPGDIVLTHNNHLFSKLIRLGQRLRYRGDDKAYARWNHVAIATGREGEIIEALGKGVVAQNLDDYEGIEYVVVNISASEESREQMVDYLLWVTDLGKQYNWGLIVLIAFELATAGHLSLNLDGSEICSTLAAEALKSAGYRFNRRNVTPADLAWYFQVYTDNPPEA